MNVIIYDHQSATILCLYLFPHDLGLGLNSCLPENQIYYIMCFLSHSSLCSGPIDFFFFFSIQYIFLIRSFYMMFIHAQLNDYIYICCFLKLSSFPMFYVYFGFVQSKFHLLFPFAHDLLYLNVNDSLWITLFQHPSNLIFKVWMVLPTYLSQLHGICNISSDERLCWQDMFRMELLFNIVLLVLYRQCNLWIFLTSHWDSESGWFVIVF